MEVMAAIKNRTSVRAYENARVEKEDVEKIMAAGTMAPSGKNGQPWRFAAVHQDKELLRKIAACTVYENFVSRADCLICVFMDKCESYHYIKDCQAIGACIQNMLLAAEALGLGACWIGEILNRDGAVKKLLRINNRYDLMAVIAVGHKSGREEKGAPRKPVQDALLLYQ